MCIGAGWVGGGCDEVHNHPARGLGGGGGGGGGGGHTFKGGILAGHYGTLL